MKVSIICPIYNEEKYIASCVKSIIDQDFDKENLELLLVDGMSTDKTRSIIGACQQEYPWIKLLDNSERIVPPAMNMGIRKAKGKIIVRIDAHAEFPTNYVSELVKQLEILNADNVGGILETLPGKHTREARLVASAMSSPFGIGNAHYRIGHKTIREVDTVPFGVYRRDLFDKIGFFDEELPRNQDDEFNARLIKNGGRIFLIPHVVIRYFARDSIKKMRKMFYQYGLFKPLVNKKVGRPATIRQLFPPLFVLSIILGLILCFFNHIFVLIFFVALSVYLVCGIIFGVKSTGKIVDAFLLPYVFLNIHLAYGWGYWVGIVKVLTNSTFKAEINR